MHPARIQPFAIIILHNHHCNTSTENKFDLKWVKRERGKFTQNRPPHERRVNYDRKWVKGLFL
jgi:hypothetical protein